MKLFCCVLQAVAYIKGVLSVYDLGCRWMFTCGQQAYADYAQISNNNVERRRIQDAAVRYGRSCRRIRDKFEVKACDTSPQDNARERKYGTDLEC